MTWTLSDLRIERLSYALGARVLGLDLRESLNDDQVAVLRSAWLEHQVLCFSEQDLDKHQFIAFAERFGELETIRAENRDADLAHLGYLTNQPRGGKPWNGFKGGTDWHSDESYTTRPTAATLVLARQLPPVGGDTMFANQYVAYETLPGKMKELINDLEVVHGKPIGGAGRNPHERPTIHPLVRVHPETGRCALYAGPRCRQIVGLSEDESRGLLDYLNRHATSYEFCYRHQWSVNDLIMWDNPSLLHIALKDYDEMNEPRHMFRTATKGIPSGRPVAD